MPRDEIVRCKEGRLHRVMWPVPRHPDTLFVKPFGRSGEMYKLRIADIVERNVKP